MSDTSPQPDAGSKTGILELLITPKAAGDAVSRYEAFLSSMVGIGQEIARFTPAESLSEEQRSRAGTMISLEVGPRVELSGDGRTLCALAAGRVCVEGGKLWIEPAMEISKDADTTSGDIDHDGDVVVRGNISDGFKLTAAGSVCVGRAIEAAEVRAGLDIHAAGGIAGKGRGIFIAGRELSCWFASQSTLHSGGDMHVHGELTACRVVCAGRLEVSSGPIVGGHITALGGVACHTLGNTQTPTLVEAGINAALRVLGASRIPTIEANRKRIQFVRQTVEPLLRNQRSLTPAQKEKATELLYDVAELETQTNRMIEELSKALDETRRRAKPVITVAQTLYGGVLVRFPGIEGIIPTTFQGPVQILPRRTGGQWHVVIESGENGSSSQPLPPRTFFDNDMIALLKVVGPMKAVA